MIRLRISDIVVCDHCGFQNEKGPRHGAGGSNLLLMVLFAAFVAIPALAHAERIDHIVAAVNNDVITSLDLEQAVSINEALSGPAQDRHRLRAETRDGLVSRLLLLQEARRLKFVELSEQDVRAQVEVFKKRLGSPEAFAAFLSGTRLSSRDLERMLGDRLLVERFIEKKIGLYVRIGREEAQRYFDSHAAQYQGKGFPEVQKQITSFLVDQELGKQVEQYLADLRSTASIRINPL
jgi:DNA-binding TFAR19-related protein (PDSD5 family)